MLIAVVVLYVLSAVLPLAGLLKLLLSAEKEATALKNVPPDSYAAVQAGLPILLRQVTTRPGGVRSDFIFIGAGVVFGAAASIWSLFLP